MQLKQLSVILGIDEVGRGPWAGPLLVCAVVLGDTQIDGITDSKALTKKKREKLSAEIHQSGAAIGLGWVHAHELDTLGMSEALRVATKRAVKQIAVPFHEIIIDGTVNFLRETPLEGYVTTLKKADALIASVGAASIVAKVARDNYMAEQAQEYPEYLFDKNVGYGTAAHQKAIALHGVTPLHRLSFKPLQQYKPAITTRQIGDGGEDATCEYLVHNGHDIIERNWRTKLCEVDIISVKHDEWYFTEVKHRKNAVHGSGLDAITPEKLRRMRRAVDMYAKCNVAMQQPKLAVAATTANPARVVEFLILDQ